jgi:hypothetical protein
MIKPQKVATMLRDLVLFSGLGCVAGAGVGFFVFLRLGLPKDPAYLTGYISGLFVISGLKLGISIWFLRIVFTALLRIWAFSCSFASSYQFKDMDLEPRNAFVEPSHDTRHDLTPTASS